MNICFLFSNNLGQPPKKDKEPKKKKPQIETMVPDVVVETEARAPEPAPTFDAPKEDQLDGGYRFYWALYQMYLYFF